MEKKNFLANVYGWNLKAFMRCIKDNKLKSEILFMGKNSAIVNVVSYEESVILGAESAWCISQHKCSWDKYVTCEKGVQLFFYNFNEPAESDDSLVGATFKVDNGVVSTYCCFTRKNNPISKVKKFDTDEEALFRTIIEPTFGDIKDELNEIICDIHKKTYKPKSKPKHQVTERNVSVDLYNPFGLEYKLIVPTYAQSSYLEDDDDFWYEDYFVNNCK